MNSEFSTLFNLGRAERLQLVEDLWDSLSEEESPAAIPQSKIDELRDRKERFQNNPESGLDWEQVKARARQRHD